MSQSAEKGSVVAQHAHHEAGHVLASIRWLGHVPREVAIYSVKDGRSGHAAIPVTSGPRVLRSDAQWRRIRVPEVVMFLGGLAAEEVAGFGKSPGIGDLEKLAHLERATVNQALIECIGEVTTATDDVEGALAALVDAFPSKSDPLGRLLRVYRFALAFLTNVRPVLDRLAIELLARRSLTAAEIEAVVGRDLIARRPADDAAQILIHPAW